MRATGRRAILSLLVVAGAGALASCVDEDVVYEDRDIYQPISEAALDFVGYADPSDANKLTVCGNCHHDYQANWEGTAHAMAWQGLQTSDHAQAFCEACHTVNSLGNVVPEPDGEPVGGHAAVSDEDGRYHDVQCESCHGPGLPHASNPMDSNVPLAPIEVGADLSFGCGECHQGAHHPFVDEWERSAHANVTIDPATRGDADGGCYRCHSGEGALLAMGVSSDYLEKDELLASDAVYAQITCAVCHDPHSATNEGQLRFPAGGVPAEQSLCAQCHDRRAQPDTRPNQEWLTPHSPSTDLLTGEAGWFPPSSGVAAGEIKGPHGEGSNPGLCATCHVVPFQAEDPLTGGTVTSVGHTFRAAVCVGADGLPTGQPGCALTVEARDFGGCAECHGTEADAAQALRTATARVAPYVNELFDLLLAVDPNLEGPGGEIDPDDRRFTVAEGALFNVALSLEGGGRRGTLQELQRSLAAAVTHNPPLVEALLVASISAVEAAYPAAAAAGSDLATVRGPAPGGN